MSELKDRSEENLVKKEIKFDPQEIAKALDSHAEPWELVKDKSLPIPEEHRKGLWCVLLNGSHSETLVYVQPEWKLVGINLRSKDDEHLPLSLQIADGITKVQAIETTETRPGEKSIFLETKNGTKIEIFQSGRYTVDNTSGREK
ncbi:MAG: hypothetical protein ACD_57C00108G0003 [uncultured bacterium]|uniref:Uncharacterized protein n=1 Tax=Candidatus Curtissbacteria bacterium RIFOXYA1_FULL_41_14 TaxID=1797737 RepID=A0A1F5HBX5_9BACT|nr:MAG: hypothetical protein ACD_57C00108G0003 [uncultured bacterium]KKR64995.1 MAG: hypothetical protein UU05_C0032G0023 [Candidatus Curtissbacteria bacterium GW2011_GWA1_40_47]KKS01109.1 MAG: hypothetical protein UU53_C0019G0027 [Candidatus Curtissbacteria bacterium GW2011_GWC2_41_21]OGD92294.1 MAG: hypothetical protein A3E14_03215 [Candidatus Curtissbacteria bacterium RIFCSPHIGHO2_12_FULL_41_13]OGD96484.1 MAG: hypothetical protein A3B52_02565 [Candidatus Curtissbacteria bacterium RIFCSPLOWO2